MKKELPSVTLIGIDCINLERLKTVADICQRDFVFGAVKLLSSIPDSDPRVVKILPVKSTIEYSDFCIKEVWKFVDTKYALIIQHDGFILNPSAWTQDFFQYDYIGAPWYYLKNVRVGNGGFSLRSRRLLELIGKNYEQIGGTRHPEDSWICGTAKDFLEKNGIVFAPVGIAQKFSKEGGERGVFWNNEFGFHGLRYTDISKWLNENPEYKNKIVQKFDNFTSFMRKYPVYDGTVHVLKCKPIQLAHYKELATGGKNYDCRLDEDLFMLDEIKAGHKIVYKLFRISFEQVGVPTFEREIKKIEKFSSKKELLAKYPKIKITPSFNLPKWRQRLASIIGNFAFPNSAPYTLIWF